MRNHKIFSEALKIVSETTELSTAQIMSPSRQTDIVDARTLIILTLDDAGLYPEQIATIMRMTSANVRYILRRRKPSKQLENNLRIIRKQLANNHLQIAEA